MQPSKKKMVLAWTQAVNKFNDDSAAK